MKIENYTLFLFDWDGTIARSLEEWHTLKRESFEEVGLTGLTDSEIASTFGRLEEGAYELGLPKSSWQTFIRKVEQKAKKRIPLAEPYSGVVELFDELKKQDKRIGLITAIPHAVLGDVLKDHRLADYFDVIVAGDDVKNGKPAPDGILHAIEEVGVDKSDTVMFGDSKHDIGAAINAGVDSVLFYPASHSLFHDVEAIKKLQPTFVIGDWGELIDEIETN